MTRSEFLRALESRLEPLDERERARQMEYYGEMLSDMMEEGMDESAAVASLGGVDAVARDILKQALPPQSAPVILRPKRGWTPLSIVLAIIGSPLWLPIAAVLLSLALVVYVLLWTVVVCLLAAGLSVFAAAAVCLIGAFQNGFAALFSLTGAALFGIGAGILIVLGTAWVVRQLIRLTGAMGRRIGAQFTGRRDTL